MQLTHLVILSLILVPQLGFASVYTIDVGNHTYDVVYSVDADIIAMEIDPELNSLLVGLNNTKDSFFEIHLPDELISAEGDQFVVLIDWIETDYQTSQYLKEPDALTTVVEFFCPYRNNRDRNSWNQCNS